MYMYDNIYIYISAYNMCIYIYMFIYIYISEYSIYTYTPNNFNVVNICQLYCSQS